MYAVDLPPARVELELGRRRHRRLTGPAGLLLALCVFLPLVRGCGDRTPIYPLELPLFLPPYLFGLVFALAATTTTARGLRHALGFLRAVAVVSLAVAALVLVIKPALGMLAAVASAVMLAAIGWQGHAERRLALGALVLGTAGTLWFGLCSTSNDALIGVWAALAASVAMLAGALVWLFEAASAPPITLPAAVAHGRRPGLSSGA